MEKPSTLPKLKIPEIKPSLQKAKIKARIAIVFKLCLRMLPRVRSAITLNKASPAKYARNAISRNKMYILVLPFNMFSTIIF